MAVLGSNAIDKDNADDYLIKIPFSLINFTIHGDYKYGEKYYDVGMVKLDKPAKLDYEINTICLPEVGVLIN